MMMKPIEGWNDFSLCEVPGGAEDDQAARPGNLHVAIAETLVHLPDSDRSRFQSCTLNWSALESTSKPYWKEAGKDMGYRLYFTTKITVF